MVTSRPHVSPRLCHSFASMTRIIRSSHVYHRCVASCIGRAAHFSMNLIFLMLDPKLTLKDALRQPKGVLRYFIFPFSHVVSKTDPQNLIEYALILKFLVVKRKLLHRHVFLGPIWSNPTHYRHLSFHSIIWCKLFRPYFPSHYEKTSFINMSTLHTHFSLKKD